MTLTVAKHLHLATGLFVVIKIDSSKDKREIGGESKPEKREIERVRIWIRKATKGAKTKLRRFIIIFSNRFQDKLLGIFARKHLDFFLNQRTSKP